MPPIEIHLRSFGGYLNFMPKSFGEDSSVAFGIGDVCPKDFSRSTDDLLNVRQRLLVHNPSR